MPAAKPLSLSASRMTSDVRKAVDAALSKHKLQNLQVGDGLAISSGIVGFIVTDNELGKKSIADISGLAASVATSLNGGEPATIIKGGQIIVGFMPLTGVASIKD